jgi:nucleotide-binding universal stress UspA family protein
MRILLAYDGSEYADAALHDLHRAGLHDVDALVLSVQEVWLPPAEMLSTSVTEQAHELLKEHREAAQAESRAVATRAAAWLREHFPHWRVQTEGAAGSPLEAIITRAESWRADLVIVGAHGRAAAPSMWPGSVTLGVLKHAQCSARVARWSGERPQSPTRLILGVDGSMHSQRLAEHVRSRCWAPGIQVRVVTVIDTRLTPLLIPGLAIGPTSDEWAHQAADRATAVLREGGLDAVAWVERGDPRRVLLNAAEAWPADGVFVAARGLTNVPSLHLGSISTALAFRAACTVEVFRETLPQAEGGMS